MQDFGDLEKWLGEEEHFGVIDGAEEFLELGEGGKINHIFVHESLAGVGIGEKINGIARQEERTSGTADGGGNGF